MKIGNGIQNIAVYEDGNELLGMADVTLPEMSPATTEVSGAGIAGKFTAPFIGQMEALSLTLNFKTVNENATSLLEPRSHMIDVRGTQQVWNATAGEFEEQAVKAVMVVIPTKNSDGKLAPSSPTDGSLEFSVSYYALYLDGVQQKEFDQFNYIYKVNGVDYLAKQRKNLGK